MIDKISFDWFIDNLIADLIVGVIFLGMLFKLMTFIKDLLKAIYITRIISIHNYPTRHNRKAVYARDRFMEIHEARNDLLSNEDTYRGQGELGSVFTCKYIDEGILQYHGLVERIATPSGWYVKKNNERFVRMVYFFCKILESKREKLMHDFISNKTSKYRQVK